MSRAPHMIEDGRALAALRLGHKLEDPESCASRLLTLTQRVKVLEDKVLFDEERGK